MRAAPDIRAMADTLPIAFYGTDAAGWITYFNEAAVALWGRRPVLGEERWCGAWRSYLPNGKPLPCEHTALPRALRGQMSKNPVGYVERPDGTRVFCRAEVRLIRDDSGNVLGAVNAMIDLTSPSAVQEQHELNFGAAPNSRMSPRQRQVFDGTVAGQSTKAIAQALGTSARTVEIHRRKLMARLNARTVADLVRLSDEADI